MRKRIRQVWQQRHLQFVLVAEMRKDGRKAIAAIARKLRAPLTTVFEAEKKLRKEKIILRYCMLLDMEALNFCIRAVFLLRRSKRIEPFLLKSPFLNNLQLLKGEKLFAEAVFRNMKQLLEFEAQVKTHIISERHIIEELKAEGAVLKF